MFISHHGSEVDVAAFVGSLLSPKSSSFMLVDDDFVAEGNLARLPALNALTPINTLVLSDVYVSRATQLEEHARQAVEQAARMRELATALASLEGYESTNDPRVFDFFLRHPDAVETLRDVRPRLVETFGPSIRLRLEPSVDDPERISVVVYDHGLPVDEALARLEEQFKGWWFTLPTEKTASLLVDMGWE